MIIPKLYLSLLCGLIFSGPADVAVSLGLTTTRDVNGVTNEYWKKQKHTVNDNALVDDLRGFGHGSLSEPTREL